MIRNRNNHPDVHDAVTAQTFETVADTRVKSAFEMAPHLTQEELAWAHGVASGGCRPVQVHEMLCKRRADAGLAMPDLTTVRRALKEFARRTSGVEARGRKRKLSARAVHGMERARRRLNKDADGDREVHWRDIMKKCRVKVHRSTARRSFKREGLDVAWRRAREKPLRKVEHEQARKDWCDARRRRSAAYWTDTVDMIIDNKTFPVPTSAAARKYTKKSHVRGHLRLPSEGLKPEYTRPGTRKNRMNAGGRVSVCAGLSNGRVVMWKYLDKRWNGAAAAELYRGAILKALKKNRGMKVRYTIVEDGDPTGYKSSVGKQGKRDAGISTIDLPPYSADLNPLDYSIWEAITNRMLERAPKGRESVAAFKKRLRRTALNLPEAIVRKAIGAMPKRIQAVYEAKGQNIACD